MSKGKVAVGILVACVVAIFANEYWVDSRTRPADARSGGQIIDTDVVPANVRVEGSGPAIVLLHGFGAAIDWWDEIAPDLARDHRVIRVDLIGHGGTDAPRSGYSIERQAALVSAILDNLGADRVTVIGHSMGGEVATALAEIKPERIEGIILIDSPATAGGNFTIMADAYFDPVLGELLSHFTSDQAIRRGLAQGFAPGFPVPERFVADLKQLTYNAFRTAHEESIAYRKSKPPYERIGALKPVPPFLAIFGARDAIVPPGHAKLFARVPGAKVAMIEGAGHSPMVESPAKTLELIRGFLASGPSGAARKAD
jgi:pimeloyl-ACP methyl ester carboxylesterase